MQLFIEHLTHIDSSYLHPEYGLAGASWLVDIIVSGDLDEQGMVMDFSLVKQKVKKLIDNTIDHSLIIAVNDPNITLTKLAQNYKVTYKFNTGTIEHISPKDAISLIDNKEITAKILESYLEAEITKELATNNLSVQIKLRTEEIQGAHYVYSHGLKKHQGNCQRIAHGHRSQIKIYESKQRNQALEQEWAKLWHGKYLANQTDLTEKVFKEKLEYYIFSYQSSQGKFQLTIPAKCCYLLDCDTTIENLATHICKNLNHKTGKKLTIYAYEGIDKGAISTYDN